MRNSRLLPYETIVQATSGEPEAVNLVLQHYRGYIRYAARISGQADQDAEDYITETLLKALFKFRLDKQPLHLQLNNRRQRAAHRAGNQQQGFLLFLRFAVAGTALSALLMQSKAEKISCFIRRF